MLQQRHPRWKVFNCFMFVDGLFRWNDSPYLLRIEGGSCNLAAFPAVAFLLALLDCSHANSLIKVMSSLALVFFHLNGMEQSSAKVRQAGAAPAMLFVAVNVPRRLNRKEEMLLVHVEQIRNTQQIDHIKIYFMVSALMALTVCTMRLSSLCSRRKSSSQVLLLAMIVLLVPRRSPERAIETTALPAAEGDKATLCCSPPSPLGFRFEGECFVIFPSPIFFELAAAILQCPQSTLQAD